MSHTSRKTLLSLLDALTLGLLLAGCGREPASRGRVFLIGLDGASWNLLDPMVKAGELRVGLYDYLVTWPPRRFPHGGFSVPVEFSSRPAPRSVTTPAACGSRFSMSPL